MKHLIVTEDNMKKVNKRTKGAKNKMPYGKGMKKKKWVPHSKHSSSLEVRFWSKVDIKGDNDCWNWIAGRTSSGYGSFGFNGTGVPAHRMVFLLTQTEIPKGLEVNHKCNNYLCCNPNHLELTTHKENIQYMHAQGRDRHSVQRAKKEAK